MLDNIYALQQHTEQSVPCASLSFEYIGFSQLVHAVSDYSSVKICCYDRAADGVWRLNEHIGIAAGFAGRNGVSRFKREGDGSTPAGLFRLGCAFGSSEKPETKMTYRKISADSYWVDDSRSRFYNTWVEGAENVDWRSAEHLGDYPGEYAYAVVIEYNTSETIPDKGSAVFLHCGNRPTSGCIALPEARLLQILKWLDPEKTPGILIT